MATAVLRSHDVLSNQMHLDAFTPSPTKPRRRRSPKPAGASSPPPKSTAVTSPAPKAPAVASPAPRAAAAASPPAKGRRSPPPRPAARKQPSPTKEKPKQGPVMEAVRILKRGEEPPAPSPAPAPAPVLAAPVVRSAAVDQRVLCSTSRIGPQQPAVTPSKVFSATNGTPSKAVAAKVTPKKVMAAPKVTPSKVVAAAAAAVCYAGPAFSAAAPEPSSLPFPAFFLNRAETEATRGLRCLLRIGELA